ncbi:MAG TPA: hypothetical protein VJU16_02505, partial [Planctomycetota bacterium]|nr:hypothetical protein [Planctomycetota bacterium]
RRSTRLRYDWQYRATLEVHRVPRSAEKPAFSVHTRNYLRRRAWRYFRRLGFKDRARYLRYALAAALEYRDEDCDSGIHFLDNWGLMHVLFAKSPVLRKSAHAWWVRNGMALRDLKPAPAFAEAWTSDEVIEVLQRAAARPVRRWALAYFKGRPELAEKLPATRLIDLLASSDPDVQAFAADRLPTAAGLESVPLETWKRLLENENLEVLTAVCDLLPKIVKGEQFTTEQLLGFATAALGPVARLGLGWLDPRPMTTTQVLELANVRASSAGDAAVALARKKLPPDFGVEAILPFLDAPSKEVRTAAWTWFAGEKRARNRVDLWAKLVESPYDDIRFALVRHVERYADSDRALRVLLARAPLETVWATVLLNIERGSRVKRLAAAQIAEAIERQPERAGQLVPLLRIAARSIRAPEFRAGLAAVVRVAARRPEVAAAITSQFPELKL